MKRLILKATVLLFLPLMLQSQELQLKGKPIVELFTDLHLNLNKDTLNTTGFGLTRAYFGYDFTLDENFSTTLIIDIGNPLDLALGSKSRRYAHFREASVRYTGEKLTLSAGISGTSIFSFQQKFWSKRYVANTYQSINGYGYVADLGLFADYKFNDKVSADASLTNGEGYSTLQLDNSLKASLGLTLKPRKWLAIRLYSDLMKKEEVFQNTLVGFVGLRSELFYIGAEGSFKSNLDLTEGHNGWGFSSTGGINITQKTEIFARFDYSSSSIMPEESQGWNYERDGSFIVTGLQHTFNKYFRAAIDYQSYFPIDNNRSISHFIFLNLHVKL